VQLSALLSKLNTTAQTQETTVRLLQQHHQNVTIMYSPSKQGLVIFVGVIVLWLLFEFMAPRLPIDFLT